MKKKQKPAQPILGRPREGRRRINVLMLPDKIAALDAQRGSTPRGKFLETFLKDNHAKK